MIAHEAINIQEKTRVFQRKLYLAAKENPKRKFGNLYDKVYRRDILINAWKQVKRNAGACGVDKQSIIDVEDYGVGKFLSELEVMLKDKKYKPSSVRRVYIPKANGEKRPLGIPTVSDRVIQTAVKIVMEPIFDANFADFSYGFRPKRSAHDALREIYLSVNRGYRCVIDADLKAFFDTIPHDKLLLLVQTKIIDRKILKLIELWLKAGVLEESEVTRSKMGTPQGGIISPLLANIYLHALDQVLVNLNKGRGPGFWPDSVMVRYADDFVILCKWSPEKYFSMAKTRLDRLGLTINEEKTRIIKAEDSFDFLGNTFIYAASKKTGKHVCFHYPSKKAMSNIKAKLKLLIKKGQHRKLPELIKDLNRVLIGWGNYFKYGNSKEQFKQVDNFVIVNLCIMLRKKYKKSGKGWKDHPPSWFYDLHGLHCLRKTVSQVGDLNRRYNKAT